MKPFNILTDSLPEAVTLFETEYPVYTDAKTWLTIAKGLEEGENIGTLLALCYKERLPENITSAYLGMLSFLNRGTDFLLPREEECRQVFSFSQDADIIFAAFYGKYGIDLTKETMHWYVFCSLFSALSAENPFADLMKIRLTDTGSIKNPQQRKRLVAMKKRFGLKGKQKEIEAAKGLESLF